MKARFWLASLGMLAALGLASGPSFADENELLEQGEKVFKKCKACHSLEEGGKSKTGPNLFGVFGRAAGSFEGFKFSDAMKNSGIVWDEQKLGEYLTDPKAYVPGNKMAFKGLPEEADRLAVIAYLKHEAMPK